MQGNSLAARFVNAMYGLDVAVNGLLGGRPLETLSGSIGRAAWAGKRWAIYLAEPAVNILASPWQEDHCRTVAAEEQVRRALMDRFGSELVPSVLRAAGG